MSLELLHTSPNISISYDMWNNWLYLDWHGEQTLDSVKESCLTITRCFLEQKYTRVLNDNTNITGFTPEVFEWLAADFLPYMHLAQIEYVAWIYSLNMDKRFHTSIALYQHTVPVVALFEDLASAYSWLRNVTFKPAPVNPSAQHSQQRLLALKSRIDTAFDIP